MLIHWQHLRYTETSRLGWYDVIMMKLSHISACPCWNWKLKLKITQFRISFCCRTPSHSLSLTCHVADDSLQVLQHPPATGARARLPLLRHHGPDTLAQHKPTHGASELSRGAVPLMCGPHPSVFLHSAQHLVNSQWRSQEVLSDATEAFH